MVSVKSEQLSHTRARSQNGNQETLLGSDPTKLRTKNYLLNRHVVQCPSEKLRERRQHQQITPGAKIPLLIERQPRPEQNSSRYPSESSKSTDNITTQKLAACLTLWEKTPTPSFLRAELSKAGLR